MDAGCRVVTHRGEGHPYWSAGASAMMQLKRNCRGGTRLPMRAAPTIPITCGSISRRAILISASFLPLLRHERPVPQNGHPSPLYTFSITACRSDAAEFHRAALRHISGQGRFKDALYFVHLENFVPVMVDDLDRDAAGGGARGRRLRDVVKTILLRLLAKAEQAVRPLRVQQRGTAAASTILLAYFISFLI